MNINKLLYSAAAVAAASAIFAASASAQVAPAKNAGARAARPAAMKPATPSAQPMAFDDMIASAVAPGERAAMVRTGRFFAANGPEMAVLAIERPQKGREKDDSVPPESRIAIFDGKTLHQVEGYSVYAEALESADLDGDGRDEIIFARRGGMDNLLEVAAVKASAPDKKGAVGVHYMLKTDGFASGKFGLVRSDDKKTLPFIAVGGFAQAPGSIEPHLEYSRIYKFNGDAKKPAMTAADTVLTTPATISQEYEYSYMLIQVGRKDEAAKRLRRLADSMKNVKSPGNAQILEAVTDLLKKHASK